MSDLVEFLAARLDEDAVEIAKHSDGEDDWEFVAKAEQDYPCTPYLMIGKKRALAEVEAKGKIISALLDSEADSARGVDETFYDAGWNGALRSALSCLAETYADHPEYREEWA